MFWVSSCDSTFLRSRSIVIHYSLSKMMMMKALVFLVVSAVLPLCNAFVAPKKPSWCHVTTTTALAGSLPVREDLFVDEEEIIPIAENYIHAKYKSCAESHGHSKCDKEDAREVLRSVLPPVTPEELDDEVTNTLGIIMQNPKNSEDSIDEDDFVKAIVQNSYWRSAGNLVVKELMFLDALYNYYRSGSAILNNEDYEELKENLTWEGSAVATMQAQEALFVTAVASARRGDPIMEDDEYQKLKADLKKQRSWVTARAPDALEKLGIKTFLGYLHRAL